MIYQFKAEGTQSGLNFDISLEKEKRVYCFIGENGVGKTQLLENMARSFLYGHSLLSYKKKLYNHFFLKDGINQNLKDLQLYLPLGIHLNNTEIKNPTKQAWRVSKFETITIPNLNVEGISKRDSEYENPIVFIGARARGYAENIASNEFKLIGTKFERFVHSFLRTFSAMNSESAKSTSAADWFVSRLMLNPNFVMGFNQSEEEIDLVCRLLESLEPEKLAGLIKNEGTRTSIGLGIFDGKLMFYGIPFDKLSTGYISIIKIFQDIIDAYSSWRIDETVKIEDTEGVVFIDEIESHLHPKWEQKILPFLKKHFPKTTFYVATHSPLVVSSTDDGEAYELVKEKNAVTAKCLGNPKGWYMADIYSQAFHLEENKEFEDAQEKILELTADYSKTVKDFMKSRTEEARRKAEEVYADLNKILAPTDPRRTAIENLKKLIA